MLHRLTEKEWNDLGLLMQDVSEIIAELAIRLVTVETHLELLEKEVEALRG